MSLNVCACCNNDYQKWRYCICRQFHDGKKPDQRIEDGQYKEVCDWCQNRTVGELTDEDKQVGHGKLCRKCAQKVIEGYRTAGLEPSEDARKVLTEMAAWRGRDGSPQKDESKAGEHRGGGKVRAA